MSAPHLYDQIGVNYRSHRRPDPRIAAAIVDALGPARTVLNVGAGAGSYEPTDRRVLAVEPSPEMIRQRPPGAAPKAPARNGSAVAEAWTTGAAPMGRWRIISFESSTATTRRSAGS